MAYDDELWVIAPKGFRPSNWVDMLKDFDVAFNLNPYLVDPCMVDTDGDSKKEEVLVVCLELLDPSDSEVTLRQSLFWEMLERAARLGLHLSFPQRFQEQFGDHWPRVESFCSEHRIQFATRSAAPE